MAATTSSSLDPHRFVTNYLTATSLTVDGVTAQRAKDAFLAQGMTLSAHLAPAHSKPREVATVQGILIDQSSALSRAYGSVTPVLSGDHSLTARVTFLATYAKNHQELFNESPAFQALFAANAHHLASKGSTSQAIITMMQAEESRLNILKQSTLPPGLIRTTDASSSSGATVPPSSAPVSSPVTHSTIEFKTGKGVMLPEETPKTLVSTEETASTIPEATPDNRWFFQKWWEALPGYEDFPTFDSILKTIKVW